MPWSVPAVVVASAAPTFAASGGPPRIIPLAACKNPGNSCNDRPRGYGFRFQVCNDDPTNSAFLYSATITSPNLPDLTFVGVEPPAPIQVPPAGQCITVQINASSTSSANLSFEAIITVQWGHTPTPPDPDDHPPIVIPVTVDGTAPDCPCP